VSRSGGRGNRTSGFGGYSLADLAIGAAALFLLIAYVPDLLRGSPTVLTTTAWPLGAVGLVALAILVARRDPAARWAAAFLAWALVAALAATRPGQALDAGWNGDRGWIYLVAYLGCWAIGRRRGTRTARVVTVGLVTGLLANAFVAFLQATTPNGRGFVQLIDGRAAGLTQNSVFLGALMSGGVALCASLAARSRRGLWWVAPAAAVAPLAMAGNLAGSRIGLIGALVLGPLASWSGRARWVRSAAVVAALGVGLIAGAALLPSSGTTRAVGTGTTSGGVANRLEMWHVGVKAWTEHPVLGWGPNGFRDATERRITLRYAKAEGPGAVYPEAHNLAVETLVTTGLPGLVALGGFAWCAFRRARGPLAWYAAGVAVTWLLEPVAIETAPTALLALGLAMAVPARRPTAEPVGGEPGPEPVAEPEPEPEPGPEPVAPDPAPASVGGRVAVWGVSIVVALGALAGAVRLVVVDHLEYQVFDTLELMRVDGGVTVDPASFVERVRLAEDAQRLLPRDPAVADVLAEERRQLAEVAPTPEHRRRYLEAARHARHLAPGRSELWFKEGLATLNATDGSERARIERARPLFLEALDRNPWSQPALRFLHKIDVETGRRADAARWARQLCALGSCPPRS
jgi:O-antigen ligase